MNPRPPVQVCAGTGGPRGRCVGCSTSPCPQAPPTSLSCGSRTATLTALNVSLRRAHLDTTALNVSLRCVTLLCTPWHHTHPPSDPCPGPGCNTRLLRRSHPRNTQHHPCCVQTVCSLTPCTIGRPRPMSCSSSASLMIRAPGTSTSAGRAAMCARQAKTPGAAAELACAVVHAWA